MDTQNETTGRQASKATEPRWELGTNGRDFPRKTVVRRVRDGDEHPDALHIATFKLEADARYVVGLVNRSADAINVTAALLARVAELEAALRGVLRRAYVPDGSQPSALDPDVHVIAHAEDIVAARAALAKGAVRP